jgi:RNA polymerase sigma factor (TIGR02999 family)
MSDVSQILNQIESGDPKAAEQLLPLVYDELRKLAAAKLAHEQPGQTLQPTALVHEAYLRLIGGDSPKLWSCRAHFFAAAAEAMRRILVEMARRKMGPKAGGRHGRAKLGDVGQQPDTSIGQYPPEEVLDIHEVLDQLASHYPEQAQLVKLRYFAGLSHQEAAEVLGISRSTADRHWRFARAYLFASLQGPK